MTTSTVSSALPTPPLSAPLIALLALGAGLSVASLYYAQPMLALLAGQFHASSADIGLVPTLTQAGYAAGLLLMAPLADRYERRRLIMAKALVLTLALLLAALAPQLWLLWLASGLIGLSATLAQDLVPVAAILAPPQRRGQSVGTVMTGLLLGILLSRVISGSLAQLCGWRTVFLSAALSIAMLAAMLWRGLPTLPPSSQLSYGQLLASLLELWRRHPALRRATLAQGLLAVAFSAFWSTLALMLSEPPLSLGSAVAGGFGLVGAAGALAAPLAGRLADRRGPPGVIRLGMWLVLGAFAAMALGPRELWLIAAAALVFDLGFQASLVSHQSVVFGLEPPARSRLNAILIGGMFMGMSLGAWGGGVAMGQWGWQGVSGLALIATAGALGLRLRC
ncbi:MFS transporter [Paucibacter sp. APW11]|uniref:MFS transporter n=1 Tax=Roseateles aquae TaxID=3077235 RepID=A0ABU3PGM9_9BURK|nr:MFS transporter [Paucibacter sp. APW11]MDT9001535.1 MFS transporter [Paucibacter sp. APW11]